MPLTLPNLLTLFRIVLILPIAVAFFVPGALPAAAAAGLFALASLSDWLDGALARLLDQRSTFGRILDPIADKLLVGVALMLLAYAGRLGPVGFLAALVVLAREIAVSGLREGLAAGHVILPVSLLAKLKTVIQMVSLCLLLAAPALGGWTGVIGEALLVAAAALSLWTFADYLRRALPALAAET